MDTYSKTIIQKFDNGVNIVHIPDLTDEERARRQAQLRRAAEQLLKEAERVKKTTGRAKRAFCVVHNSTIVVPLIPLLHKKGVQLSSAHHIEGTLDKQKGEH